MENFLFILRIVLVAIFGVAGFAKLFDLEGSKKAVEGFGVPESLSKPPGVLLPIAEITIAVLLLFVQTSWFGAIGAAALLGIFIAGMTYQWSKGNAPDCHCFGQVHSEPVSPKSIIRNIIFVLPAIGLIVAGKENQGLNLFTSNNNNLSDDTMTIIIGLAVIGLLAAVVYFLKQISEQQVQIMRRIEILEFTANDGTKEVERENLSNPLEGLPIGAVAPEFELPDLNGKKLKLKDLLKPSKTTAFFFVSPSCNPCGALLPEIEKWQADYKDKVNFVFVSSGEVKENADKFAGTTLKQIILQQDREVAELYQAKWTPTIVLVTPDGRIASRVAAGDSAIRAIFEKLAEEKSAEDFFYINEDAEGIGKLGQVIPEFELQDVAGKTFTANEILGKQTLITYWSPGCGWCQRMLEDLRNWDKTKGQDEPNLLVISSGDADTNKDLGFKSPIVLDDKGAFSGELGMSGTPSAVLINQKGKIVSEVAVGADNIWSLIGKKIEAPKVETK